MIGEGVELAGRLHPPDRHIVIAAEEDAPAVTGEGHELERAAAGEHLLLPPRRESPDRRLHRAAGQPVAAQGQPAPIGREGEIERPVPHGTERDDLADPARRQVAHGDLPSPPQGDQRRPVGGEHQAIGTHRVGVDPGRRLPTQVPDEHPVRRRAGSDVPPIARDGEGRGVGLAVGDRPDDPAARRVAQGDPAVRLPDREGFPVGERHDETEPADDVARPRLRPVRGHVPGPDRPDLPGVAGDDGEDPAAGHEGHHADLAGDDALLPGEEPAAGHVPEREILLADRGAVTAAGRGEDPPVGREGEPFRRAGVTRECGPLASRVHVPEDDAARRIARGQRAAVGGQLDVADRRPVAAEQRDLATAELPEVSPGEIAMPGAGPVDVVEKDLLHPLELSDVVRLAGQPQLGGVQVPVGQHLALLGDPPLPIGLVGEVVGPADLAPEPLVVRSEPGIRPDDPSGRAGRDHHRQGGQGRVRGVAPRPFHQSFSCRRGAGQDRLAGQEPPEVLGQRRGRRIAADCVLLEAVQADRLQVAGEVRAQHPGRDRVLLDDLADRLGRRLAPERRARR